VNCFKKKIAEFLNLDLKNLCSNTLNDETQFEHENPIINLILIFFFKIIIITTLTEISNKS